MISCSCQYSIHPAGHERKELTMLKRQANNNNLQLAEERIAQFKLSPETENETKNGYQFGRKGNSFFVQEAQVLNLKDLGLKTVPESLRTIRHLTLLDLEGNNIQKLPSWIGELSSLEAINLNGNQLQELPPEIGSLNKLLVLMLEDNQLHSLPETLLELCLRSREKHKHLIYVGLYGNPDLGLPDSIINSDPMEILRYYFGSRNEKGRPLLELKLLLVGRGKAGKTTLVKQLGGEKPDENESRDTFNRHPRTDSWMPAWPSADAGMGFRRAGNSPFNTPVFPDREKSLPARIGTTLWSRSA